MEFLSRPLGLTASLSDATEARLRKAHDRGLLLHDISLGRVCGLDVLRLAAAGRDDASSITLRQLITESPLAGRYTADRILKVFSEVYGRPAPFGARLSWLVSPGSHGQRFIALCTAVAMARSRYSLSGSNPAPTPPQPRDLFHSDGYPFAKPSAMARSGVSNNLNPPPTAGGHK